MIKKLIKLADRLDRDGNQTDADLIDSILKLSEIEEKIDLSDWISANVSDEELSDMQSESEELDRVMENLYNHLND